jgi:alkylation response protein AidB-like acyl-CoA dehydrogenase
MIMDLAPEDHPTRLAFRAWVAEHPDPTDRQLAESGYVAPHWPKPYGLGAGPIDQLIIDEEIERAGISRPQNAIGIGWAGPTIIHAGTQEQKDRYLLPILAGEEIWCQMFSEPGSGSDLANLSTRAERDGDIFRVNGQKIWTSGAHNSAFGILIARTDPDAPKHKGISYFICPTDVPGIELRPIIDMTTAYSFNEVFFTDAEIPAENLVGTEHDGWRLAKVTLANERVSLSTGGVLWGMGPKTDDLIDLVRSNGGTSDPLMRQRLADTYIEGKILDLIRQRTLMAQLAGKGIGPEASIRKILADEHGQKVMTLAKDLAGAAGMLEGSGPGLGGNIRSRQGEDTWHWGYLFSQALTIGGGTGEVQRNIVAERVLGLPREPDQSRGMTWRESQHAR